MSRGLVLSLCLLPLVASAADGVWIGVGYGGRRIVSTDAKEWTITAEWAQPGGDDSNNLMSAAVGDGKCVVVGGGGGGKTGGGHILVTTDGREWKETFTDKGRINPVLFGGGRFIVGTSAWPSGKLMWSTDAENWKPGAAIKSAGLSHYRGGAYGNERFVFVGNGSKKNDAGENVPIHWAVTSPDGESIASEVTTLPGHGRIVFGAGRFVMLTSHANADLIASTDGADWKPVTVAEGAKFNWLVWTGAAFLVGDHKASYRSADGTAWEKIDLLSRAEVQWSDGKTFITTSWPGKMGFSLDGKTWERSPALTDNGINMVVFLPTGKK